MSVLAQPLPWDTTLIQRYNLAGPRYTSYPTAPQFNEEFSLTDWQNAMEEGSRQRRPLSLYVHIPFCSTICYYCGCNKIVTANRQRTEPYMRALHREIVLQAALVDRTRPVDQLHWGGGTPTYLSDAQMTGLMHYLDAEFPLHRNDSGEYSIEIHPQSVTPKRLDHLRALGFNRLSFGVQDFDPEVQKAVNRFNSEIEVSELIQASRALGFRSLNLDLIYGLPKQNAASFSRTLDKIIAMRPDRLSLFNYAHMPHLFKTQQQINTADLPEPQEKLKILHNSIVQLEEAGYIYIGMDHFALPTDELTKAQRKGVLQRNFQGYSTHGNCDLLAFGVSSISAVDDVYMQNVKNISDYQHALEQNHLPMEKGLVLSLDDRIRRRVITRLICQFEIDFCDIEKQFSISFADYFSPELEALYPMQRDGLLTINATGIRVNAIGRLLIRHICMAFDAYVKNIKVNTEAPRYSRII